jgi:fatty acid amide hydrolase 2
MNPLLTMSATELARRIRTGEVTSLEVVDTHIDHIRRVNPVINAVVRDRFAEAREEAQEADRRVRSEPTAALPPFHGVPCTIKECFLLTGMPNSSGLLARKHVVATEDAEAVIRLRRAGAIPLGVTNVSELCMWMETNNRVYGRTNNPYDPRRIVGGSSGGEGAIVGAGGAPFGLGADIGGSIRMPAFFNGVFGHKPTGGLVPGTGQYPIAHGDALRYLTTGPLCRRAEDLMPLLRVLAGPDGRDTGCYALPLGDVSSVDLKGLRVIDVADNGRIPVTPDLRAAQERAVAALADRGARIEQGRFEGLTRSLEIWSSMLAAAGGPTFSELLGNGRPTRTGRQLIRWVLRRSPHTLPALVLVGIEKVTQLMPKQVEQMIRLGEALREELTARIGIDGVLLYPPHARPAPRHYKPLWPPFNWVYTAIFNVMQFPVTQVPLGLNAEGLPLGVQVASIPGHDHVTIAVALELEKAFGGWVPPRPLRR